MSNPPWNPPDGEKQLITRLKKAHGNITFVAEHYDITRETLYNYLKRHKKVQQIREDARESMLDRAESVLYSKVLQGDNTALIFFLKTQGYKRGYVERHEIGGISGGTAIKLVWDNANSDDASSS